jgi:hypothetical protein
MTEMLQAEGQAINRKRVQRLMRRMGIAALGPKPRTTKPAPGHAICPYLLRDVTVERPSGSGPITGFTLAAQQLLAGPSVTSEAAPALLPQNNASRGLRARVEISRTKSSLLSDPVHIPVSGAAIG